MNNMNYKGITLEDFRNRIVRIDGLDIAIWEDFGDDLLGACIKRYKLLKEEPNEFYEIYSPNFYDYIYRPFFEDFERYNNCDPNVNLPEFWYWYEKK